MGLVGLYGGAHVEQYNIQKSQKRQIHDFKDALVKGGTTKPMERSKVMPIKSFKDLFYSWPSNQDLSVKDLQMKAITLLAIVPMLHRLQELAM